MRLNPIQVASLTRLLKYRIRSPSYGERLRLCASVILLLMVPAVLLGYLVVRLDVPGGILLPVGLFVGAVLWEMLRQKRFVQWWPFNREITDWDKVERLLADARDASVTQPATSGSPQKRRQTVLLGVLLFTILVGLMFGGQRALAFIHDPRRGNPSDGVVILTAPWCGFCMNLRAQLAQNRIPYTDIDVEKSAEGRWAFTAVRGTGVPITIIGDQIVRGTRWHDIDRLLKAAGYHDFKPPDAGLADLPLSQPDAGSARTAVSHGAESALESTLSRP
jgi:glutaredoxin